AAVTPPGSFCVGMAAVPSVTSPLAARDSAEKLSVQFEEGPAHSPVRHPATSRSKRSQVTSTNSVAVASPQVFRESPKRISLAKAPKDQTEARPEAKARVKAKARAKAKDLSARGSTRTQTKKSAAAVHEQGEPGGRQTRSRSRRQAALSTPSEEAAHSS